MRVYIAIATVLITIAASFWLVIIRFRQIVFKMDHYKEEEGKRTEKRLEKQESFCMGVILSAGMVCVLCIFLR